MAGRKRNLTMPFGDEDRKEDLENLLVFGYQCKVFRDDEKAEWIERGRHLIPWMGDPSLLIDRYDGRGHLYDLKPYDAVLQPAYQPTEEERHIEALYDEERYLELHNDLSERAMYEEEEMKRLNEALQDNSYGAVGFNYLEQQQQYDPSQPTDEKTAEEEEEEEEMYEPHPDLQVPPGMILPKTVKLNAIIERTANFVNKQGMQMEIVIKARHGDNNQQFDFLNFEHELNAYYKHVVKMIKSGRYRPQPVKDRRKRSLSSEGGEEDGYLHPSLMKPTNEPVSPPENFLKTVEAKLPPGQITNTLYATLVRNIGRHHTDRASPVPVAAPLHAGIRKSHSSGEFRDLHQGPLLPPGVGGTTTMPAFSSQTHNDEKLYYPGKEYKMQPPIPGMEPVTLPDHSANVSPVHIQCTASVQPISASVQQISASVQPCAASVQPCAASVQPSQPAAVETSNSHLEGPGHIVPPPDIQPIVDKMAFYVAKNGSDFEIVVKSKKDERFDFVQSWHPYNNYFEHMKRQYQKEYSSTRNGEDSDGENSQTSDDSARGQSGKAVAFTIKTRDSDTPTLGSRTALLYESSEDEHDDDRKKEEDMGSSTSVDPTEEVTHRAERSQASVENLERRQAEDKLKDRLASAARDKMAQSSREKQLKAERKRKAAMFISMLKDKPGTNSAAGTVDMSPPHEQTVPVSVVQPNKVDTPMHTTQVSTRQKSPPRPISPSRIYKKRRSPVRSRSRSRSRSLSPYSSRRRRHKSKTPPSAYLRLRRSKARSPTRKKRSRSRSPARYHRKGSSRSPTRSSAIRSKGSSPSRSRRSRSKDRSKRSTKSPSTSSKGRERKRSRSRSKSKSKSKRKRSRSRSKERSKGRSKSSKKSSDSKDSSSKSSNTHSHSSSRTSSSKRKHNSSPSRISSKMPVQTSVDDPIQIDDEPTELDSVVETRAKGSSSVVSDGTTDSPVSASGRDTNTSATAASQAVSEDLMSKVRAMLAATRGSEGAGS